MNSVLGKQTGTLLLDFCAIVLMLITIMTLNVNHYHLGGSFGFLMVQYIHVHVICQLGAK